MEYSRTCDRCNVDVHRASYARHLKRKKHLESMIHNYTRMLIERRTRTC